MLRLTSVNSNVHVTAKGQSGRANVVEWGEDRRRVLDEPDEFSLVIGGPCYAFLSRVRLLKSPLHLLHRRILATAALMWLPLAGLTAISGTLIGGVGVPLLLDIEAFTRCFIVVPLLFLSEKAVHERLSTAVRQFTTRNLIREADQDRFNEILRSAIRARNSVLMEVIILIVAVGIGFLLWSRTAPPNVDTWHSTSSHGNVRLTTAGLWYAYVSLSTLRFLAFRWYYRIFVWYWLLLQTAKLRLQTNALHPDRAAGLGFLNESAFGMLPLMLAHTLMLAGVVANRILHQGANLQDFTMEIVGIMVLLTLLPLFPLTFFAPQLARAKRTALLQFGSLGNQYVRMFWSRWLNQGDLQRDSLLGTGDIQSLADLSNSFTVVRETRIVPFTKEVVGYLAGFTVAPLLPLVLTVMPLTEILSRLVKLLF